MANTRVHTELVGPGGVVQMVAYESGAAFSTSAAIPFDDTIPQNTEGGEWGTVSITPKSASNLLVITATMFANLSAGDPATMCLFQDSNANAIATTTTGITAGYRDILSLTHKMTAGTTSSTTFKIRVGSGSGFTLTINGVSTSRYFGGSACASLVVWEVAA